MVAKVVQAACSREHSRPVCGIFIGAVFDDSARLRLLHQLGCAFAARTELEDLCRLVISKCGEALQAEGVGILLQDPSTQELFFPYVSNEDPVAAERLRGLRFPADRGMPERCCAAGGRSGSTTFAQTVAFTRASTSSRVPARATSLRHRCAASRE